MILKTFLILVQKNIMIMIEYLNYFSDIQKYEKININYLKYIID